jgi:tripartite motif-containing protein 71
VGRRGQPRERKRVRCQPGEPRDRGVLVRWRLRDALGVPWHGQREIRLPAGRGLRSHNRIQRFRILSSGKGSWLASYGSAGTAPGEFATPTGIDVAPDGTIWVADTQNGRIQERDPSTGAWTAYTVASGDPTNFKSPWGVSVAPDGEIWVADSALDRLVRMTSSGELTSTVDADSLGIAEMDAPFTVEFGPSGEIYVSVVWNNRILHLTEI